MMNDKEFAEMQKVK